MQNPIPYLQQMGVYESDTRSNYKDEEDVQMKNDDGHNR
jgi:hypothetical protein